MEYRVRFGATFEDGLVVQGYGKHMGEHTSTSGLGCPGCTWIVMGQKLHMYDFIFRGTTNMGNHFMWLLTILAPETLAFPLPNNRKVVPIRGWGFSGSYLCHKQ